MFNKKIKALKVLFCQEKKIVNMRNKNFIYSDKIFK